MFYFWQVMLPIIGQVLYIAASFLALLSIGLFLYKKNKETGFFLIVLYLVYSIISDTIINRFIEIVYSNASLGPRIFTVVEFFILNYFIRFKIKNTLLKRLMLPIGLVFFLICVYDFLTSAKNQLDSLPIGTGAVIILFYLIYFLFEQLNDTANTFLYTKPDFWIITGLVMYTSGTFFTMITSQSKYTEENFRATYMLILSTFTLLRNILFLVGFYILPKKDFHRISTK